MRQPISTPRVNRNHVFLFIILAFPAILLLDLIVLEPNVLVVSENTFDLFDDNAAEGSGSGAGELKIVFISDIHSGLQREEYVEGLVGRINALEPDIVLIGGDIIEGDESELDMLGPLAELDARHGVYAVLGNHDYGEWGCPTDPVLGDKIEERLEGLGITVLRNENELLDFDGKKLALIGLDDAWVCRQDYAKASEGVGDDVPKIVLAHNWLAVDVSKVRGRSVILSGHTHCGHVNVPFITEAVLAQAGFGDFMGGRKDMDDDTGLYVTCGAGEAGLRFRTHPEISVIEIE